MVKSLEDLCLDFLLKHCNLNYFTDEDVECYKLFSIIKSMNSQQRLPLVIIYCVNAVQIWLIEMNFVVFVIGVCFTRTYNLLW